MLWFYESGVGIWYYSDILEARKPVARTVEKENELQNTTFFENPLFIILLPRQTTELYIYGYIIEIYFSYIMAIEFPDDDVDE